MESFASRIEATASEPGPAPAGLRNIVRAIFDFVGEHPEAPRFMLREIALSGRPPAVAVPYVRRNLRAITSVIRSGQQRGDLRDVEPVLATFTLISPCIWFALVRQGLAQVVGPPLDRPDHARLMERRIGDVVEHAFAARHTR